MFHVEQKTREKKGISRKRKKEAEAGKTEGEGGGKED